MENDTTFYVVGGTLPTTAPSYVTRKADEDLYNGLSQGEFCYVLTSRQMGKSSLMTRTAVRLRQEGTAVVVLDLTAIGTSVTQEQWYYGLLDRMGTQLKLEKELDEFWQAHMQLGPLQRWTSAMRDVVLVRRPDRIVIFVDEIDQVRSLPFSTDDFFAAIRECHNRRTQDPEFSRLTFCLLGVATPADLIQDPHTTPFNIGRRIELTDFTVHEAGPLAQGLDREPQAGAQLLEQVLYWTNGHPYLTQRLCQTLAEDVNAHQPDDVDRQCEELFLSARARERDPNLLFVREGVLRNRADVAGLLDLYSRVHRGKRVQDDETNPLVNALRLAGLTRVESGALHSRNRIYKRVFDRKWISESMPDVEIRLQRAALRKGVAWTALAASLIIGAGLWYWDAHYRQIEEYYSAIVTRWGGPEGIGKLSWNEVRHRQWSIKLSRHGRNNPVEELAVVDSRGRCPLQPNNLFSLEALNPIGKNTSDSVFSFSETHVMCQVTFTRDVSGKVTTQEVKNRNNRVLYALRYVSPTLASYKEGDFDAPRSKTGITHVQFDRIASGPQAGMDREIYFLDGKGQRQPAPSGVFGLRYVRNEQGMPIEEINLNAKGEPTVNNMGTARMRRVFDEQGNLVKETTFDVNDHPLRDGSGVASVKRSHDRYGNPTKFEAFDANGQPVVSSASNAAVIARAYNEEGDLTEVSFLDPNMQLVQGRDKHAKITFVYESPDTLVEAYYGADNKPKQMEESFVKTRVVRDPRGNVVGLTYLDEHGTPVRLKGGYTKIKFGYDDRGNNTKREYLDEKDQPVRRTDDGGYATIEREYDPHNNNTMMRFKGPNGEPAIIDDCYVEIEWKYNEHGKKTEEAYFDGKGNLTKCAFGFAKQKKDYDLQGNQTEVAYYDEKDQPTRHKDGYHKATMKYDERGKLTEAAYFDEAGHRIRWADGYAKLTQKHDERGNLIEQAFFDENDHLVLQKIGIAKGQWKYNDKNQVVETTFFGTDGEPILRKEDGWTSRKDMYDDRGNLVEVTLFDAKGRLVRNGQGWAKVTLVYNELSRATGRTYFDEKNQAVQTRVFVRDIETKSKAERIGLQKGDLIHSYDGKDPVNEYVFEQELLPSKGDRPRELKVLRNGKDLTFLIDPGQIDGLTVGDRVPPQSLLATAQSAKKQ